MTTRKPNHHKNKIIVGYTHTRGDRSGACIYDMLMGHAYAFSQNLLYGDFAYGGACSGTRGPLPLEPVHEELIQFLGLQDVLKFACPKHLLQNKKNGTTTNYDDNDGEIPVLLERKHYRKDETALITPEWLEYIRQHVHYPAVEKSNSSPSSRNVVLHIRRGDVGPCTRKSQGRKKDDKNAYRYLPNSHYRRILEHYVFNKNNKNDTIPNKKNYNISIYSEHVSFEPWQEQDFGIHNNNDDLTTTTSSSTVVSFHLDSSLQDAWRAMMMADVLILSKSSFSFVPALLNPHGQVLYTPFWHAPLPGWTVVDDASILEQTQAELEKMRQQEHC